MMNLRLTRDILGSTYTLGTLEVDVGKGWQPFGYTCEDVDRGLTSDMGLDEIAAIKVRGQTAIPLGTYQLQDTWSPKYQVDKLLVSGVPGFQGIRIHAGNDATHTEGCLLPGLTRDVEAGTVAKSKLAVAWLESTGRKLGLGSIEIRRDAQ